MIHQLIFASPKPGMSEEEFQRYWVEEHAVRYASKIPQIKRYMIDTRIAEPDETEEPLWSGIAEIWLPNEEEQLASLQTPEFLQGARLDEPNWAAFWKTLVLDTDTHTLLEGPPLTPDPTWVKVLTIYKRREGLPLQDFRRTFLEEHGPRVLEVPGVRRYLQNHVRDGFYAVGESRFDGAEQVYFDDLSALKEGLASDAYTAVRDALPDLVETRWVYSFNVREHWVIGPEARP